MRLFPNGELDPSFVSNISGAFSLDQHDDVITYGSLGFRRLAGYASPVVGPFLGTNGTVTLQLYGETGTRWQTETSADLRGWQPWGLHTIPSTNQLTVIAPPDTNGSAHFYRVTKIP